jgi:hypothetical protein
MVEIVKDPSLTVSKKNYLMEKLEDALSKKKGDDTARRL